MVVIPMERSKEEFSAELNQIYQREPEIMRAILIKQINEPGTPTRLFVADMLAILI
jgi:hypothetical protein